MAYIAQDLRLPSAYERAVRRLFETLDRLE